MTNLEPILSPARAALLAADHAAGLGVHLSALRELARAEEAIAAAIAATVRDARADGSTWQHIGDALAVSKQAAQQRYGR